MEERIQKIISRYGFASRRKAEQLIADKRVRINGNTAKLGDTAIDGEDVIEVDGEKLGKACERVYLILNKPRGYVTTLQDEKQRHNVSELVFDCGLRVYPVGRLDMFSEGLLILTNDGELANRLMHPKSEIPKKYLVWVSDYASEKIPALSDPIEINGKMTKPALVRLIRAEGQIALLEIVIHEGKNRQIRRLCEYARLNVTRLKRIEEGDIKLGKLEVGKWRYLTIEEVNCLFGL